MPVVYEREELDRFSCRTHKNLTVHKLLLTTGLRMQEARWLEWGDVGDGFIRVSAKPHWTPKTHEERSVPIPQWMADMLNLMPKTSRLIFPTALSNADFHMLRTCKRIAKAAGLDEAKWSLHGFRRTAITHWLRSGFDPRTVMSFAGHSSMKSCLRYLRPLEGQSVRDKIEAIWK
jgi:integrase